MDVPAFEFQVSYALVIPWVIRIGFAVLHAFDPDTPRTTRAFQCEQRINPHAWF